MSKTDRAHIQGIVVAKSIDGEIVGLGLCSFLNVASSAGCWPELQARTAVQGARSERPATVAQGSDLLRVAAESDQIFAPLGGGSGVGFERPSLRHEPKFLMIWGP